MRIRITKMKNIILIVCNFGKMSELWNVARVLNLLKCFRGFRAIVDGWGCLYTTIMLVTTWCWTFGIMSKIYMMVLMRPLHTLNLFVDIQNPLGGFSRVIWALEVHKMHAIIYPFWDFRKDAWSVVKWWLYSFWNVLGYFTAIINGLKSIRSKAYWVAHIEFRICVDPSIWV